MVASCVRAPDCWKGRSRFFFTVGAGGAQYQYVYVTHIFYQRRGSCQDSLSVFDRQRNYRFALEAFNLEGIAVRHLAYDGESVAAQGVLELLLIAGFDFSQKARVGFGEQQHVVALNFLARGELVERNFRAAVSGERPSRPAPLPALPRRGRGRLAPGCGKWRRSGCAISLREVSVRTTGELLPDIAQMIEILRAAHLREVAPII